MKVDPRAIAGIGEKVARAHHHLCVLHDEMRAWDARHPWRLAPPEIHDHGREHVFRLRLDEAIPVGWAVTLGEALHDLRSALDQSIYWLTVDAKRKPLDSTSFPVYRTRRDFEAWSKRRKAWSTTGGMHKIRGIGPGPHAFVEALQPYPQRYRRAQCYELRLLHDLWNQDKHRLVHLWGLRFVDEQLRFPKHIDADCSVGVYRRILHDGAVALRITCGSPHADVQMVGEMTAAISVKAGKRASGGQVGLWGIYWTAADVIGKLVDAIGQQSRPINLTTWTATTVGAL